MLPISFRVLLEVNQPWDWNAYWNNDKYLDEPDYKTSAQPSVVYAVTINLESMQDKVFSQSDRSWSLFWQGWHTLYRFIEPDNGS